MANELIKIEQETKELETIAGKMMDQYKTFTISSPEEYSASGDILKKVKGKLSELDDRQKEITRPMDEAKKAVMALFKKPRTLLENLESKIKDAILDFQDKMEREKLAKEAELRKAQEAEAKRLEAKARKTKDEEKRKELLESAEATRAITPMVNAEIPKVDGISMAENWTFEVINKDLIPREYLIPDEKTLGAVARATRGSLQIPGVKIYSYKGVKAGKK